MCFYENVKTSQRCLTDLKLRTHNIQTGTVTRSTNLGHRLPSNSFYTPVNNSVCLNSISMPSFPTSVSVLTNVYLTEYPPTHYKVSWKVLFFPEGHEDPVVHCFPFHNFGMEFPTCAWLGVYILLVALCTSQTQTCSVRYVNNRCACLL